MSAGDIDDHIAGEVEYQRVLVNPQVRSYFSRAHTLPIIRDFDIPFGAGISSDGERRYIDRHLRILWRGRDLSHVLAAHESFEWAARRFAGIGVDYASDSRGHELANRAEFLALGKLFPGANLWVAYNAFIDPQVKREETESIINPPKDLALYPYRGTPMAAHLISKGVEDVD